MRLVLASGSPRRRELLALLGLPFDGRSRPTSTRSVRPGETPIELVRRAGPRQGRWRSPAVAPTVSSCSPPTRPSRSPVRSSASRPTTTTPGGCCGHCRRGPTWCTRRVAVRRHGSDGAGSRHDDGDDGPDVGRRDRVVPGDGRTGGQGRRLRHPGHRRSVRGGDRRAAPATSSGCRWPTVVELLVGRASRSRRLARLALSASGC